MVHASLPELVEASPASLERAAARALPERLAVVWTIALLFTDVLAVLAAAYALGLPASAGPAACLVVCGALALCGAYGTSFAARPRDEAYHVGATGALAALPFWALLHLVAGLASFVVLATLALALAAIALVRGLLHAARHLDDDPPTGGAAFVSPQAQWRARRRAFAAWKSGLDVTLASAGLLLLSPVLAVAAIGIALESSGPVFFTQRRAGRAGAPFTLIKLRTMRLDAGGAWARSGDARITRVGAFLRRSSIDEIPQLLNVIRGEMSLVGPRPEMLEYARRFSKTIPHYDERHLLRPGLTGWAQVQLERNLAPDDVPRVAPYDLFYVEHASPVLDAIVILKTAAEFLFQRAV
ncbi:MAG: sugar transferase [Candidatus Baltobacteraceae bacterium]